MKRILVAMSGGVDSTVAAWLLKNQGYEVIGATLNLWSYDQGRLEPYNECCSLEVRLVARQLGIEHHFVDAGLDFEREVVQPFIAAYLAGRTPSPCARCNRLVRFPQLLEVAQRLGCEKLATGHHARLRRLADGSLALLKGCDRWKDQSYFLSGLRPEQLGRLLFPVGELEKAQVRELARSQRLISARKPESQDLCFIPGGDYHHFLQAQAAEGLISPGEIVDSSGRVLGQHQGLPYYTIGQRRGLGISAAEKLYVLALDVLNNRLIVGPEAELYSEGLQAEELNLLVELPREREIEVEIKTRYRSPAVPAQLRLSAAGSQARLRFRQPQRAVTPGQVVAFYWGERLLGGGLISRALRFSGPQRAVMDPFIPLSR